jgi:hypothetical protein
MFIEYDLEDGTTILVMAPESASSGVVQASRTKDTVIIKAIKKFEEAFEPIKKQAISLRRTFIDLQADEVEVSFSLTADGEVGNFAIGKAGVEANYEVTLKWNNVKRKTLSKKRK